jgi:hypothetical protein
LLAESLPGANPAVRDHWLAPIGCGADLFAATPAC